MNAIIIADVITMVVFAVGIVIYTDRAIHAIQNSQKVMHQKMDDSISRCASFHVESRLDQKELLNIFVESQRENRQEHKEIVSTLQAIQKAMVTTEKVMDAWISKNFQGGGK